MTPFDGDPLDYYPDSLLEPVGAERLGEWEAFLRGVTGRPIVLDPAYVAHVLRFHGGIPKRRLFRDADGASDAIGEFLHFLDLPPGHPQAYDDVFSVWRATADRLGGGRLRRNAVVA